MKQKNTIGIQGRLRWETICDGKVISKSDWVENLITNAGRAAISGLIGNTGAITAFTYLCVGTSATAASVTDTQLGAEITDSGLSRVAASVSRQTTNVTNDTLQLTTTFSVSGTKSVNEIGIGNNASANTGILLSHKITSAAIALIASTQFTLTYQIIIT